jgi:hypothetical protein
MLVVMVEGSGLYLHQLVKVAQIDAAREPDGLAWWAR